MYVFDKPVSKIKYIVENRIPLDTDLLLKNVFESLKDNVYYNIQIIHRTRHLKAGNIIGSKYEILKLKELEFYLNFVVSNVSILPDKTTAKILWN
jgi:hypothetical protein